MTMITTSVPIIQNHPSKLSWFVPAAMNQVVKTIPQVAVSALIGCSLNWMGLIKIHADMTPRDAAVYFALLPIITKLADPIFKQLILERDCKDQKQLAARRTIQHYIKLSCTPLLAKFGYSLVAKFFNFQPITIGEVMRNQIFMYQTQAMIMGACQMISTTIKTFNDAYNLQIPLDQLDPMAPASSETGILKTSSSK